MARQPLPKPRCSGTMTESAFFSFIRSGLRQKSTRWKPAFDAKKEAQRPYKGEDKRTKFVYVCAICENEFKDKDVALDHITPCGSLKSFADLAGFCERLFCEKEGYRVLCANCHRIITNKERERGRLAQE